MAARDDDMIRRAIEQARQIELRAAMNDPSPAAVFWRSNQKRRSSPPFCCQCSRRHFGKCQTKEN